MNNDIKCIKDNLDKKMNSDKLSFSVSFIKNQ